MQVDYSSDPASTPSLVYTYDRRGRQRTSTQGSAVCTLLYNDANQILSESYSGGPLNGISITNVYDSFLRRTNNVTLLGGVVLTTITNNFDAASRLQTISDGTNSATYSYLANSPLVSQIAFQQSGTTRMTTTKSYDNLNRLTSISSTNGSAVLASFGYQYNSANQRTQVTNNDNSDWAYQYDNLGQVTSGKKYWSDGTPVAGEQFGYGFDDIGNRQTIAAGGDQFGANLRYASYSANSLNQYTGRTVPGAVDVIGTATNTATVTVNNTPTSRKGTYYRAQLPVNNSTGPVSQSVTNLAVLNQGTSADIVTNTTGSLLLPPANQAFYYDADGNLTNDTVWNYVWDGENRLIQMSNVTALATSALKKLDFVYDYQGRRVQKIVSTNSGSSWVSASTNSFVYDGWNLIAELNGANNALIRSYMWGNDLSGSMRGAGGVGGLLKVTYAGASVTNSFVAYDGNGNVSGLINAADGSIVARYEYGPFGEVLRATGPMANPFRFSTKYQDDETDLAYYGYRYYNANTGRWLSRDPIGEQISEEGVEEPNLYCFVANDSVVGYDFLGLKSRCDNDKDCMRCLLFHEGRGNNNKCLAALRDVIANRAKLNKRSICDEANSGAYSGAKKSDGNYLKCCNQKWCSDITKDKNGNSVKPYNPDKEDMSRIDDFIKSDGIESKGESIIRFHDTSITKPESWGDEFVEVPVPGCDSFKFYIKVHKPSTTKKPTKK